jgi:hypothetical protein
MNTSAQWRFSISIVVLTSSFDGAIAENAAGPLHRRPARVEAPEKADHHALAHEAAAVAFATASVCYSMRLDKKVSLPVRRFATSICMCLLGEDSS